jgi:hypothetical protein
MEAAVCFEMLVSTTKLHSIPSKKIIILILTAIKISKLIFSIWRFYSLFSLPVVYNSPSPTPSGYFLKMTALLAKLQLARLRPYRQLGSRET